MKNQLPNINKRLENHHGNLVFFVGSLEDLQVQRLWSYASGSAGTYTFQADYELIIVFCYGEAAPPYSYSGQGTLLFSFDQTGTNPRCRIRGILNVKAGERVSAGYGVQILALASS